jgi:hypothetical protein
MATGPLVRSLPGIRLDVAKSTTRNDAQVDVFTDQSAERQGSVKSKVVTCYCFF